MYNQLNWSHFFDLKQQYWLIKNRNMLMDCCHYTNVHFYLTDWKLCLYNSAHYCIIRDTKSEHRILESYIKEQKIILKIMFTEIILF